MNNLSLSFAGPRRIQKALEHQLGGAAARNEALLGDCLVHLGYLRANQIEKILAEQKRHDCLFGEAALRLKLTTKDQLHTALALQDGYLNPLHKPLDLPKGLAILRRPDGLAAERIRLLRTRLLTMQSAEALSLFSIIPAAYNVRADYIACNLAASFAQLGRKTLLIDSDLRKPRIRPFLKIERHPGFASLLNGKAALADVIQDTLVTNLSVITASPQQNNPQELLATERLPLIFKETKQNFDIVMVMTPPDGREGDGQFAWAATGAGLVVTRKDVTRFRALKSLQTTLRQLDVSLLGAVMTR